MSFYQKSHAFDTCASSATSWPPGLAGLDPANPLMTIGLMAIPTKTLAVRLFEYGGPEKLVLNEYNLPALGDHDVLVKNLAGSVSRWDVKYRAGDLARYQLPGRAAFPLP